MGTDQENDRLLFISLIRNSGHSSRIFGNSIRMLRRSRLDTRDMDAETDRSAATQPWTFPKPAYLTPCPRRPKRRRTLPPHRILQSRRPESGLRLDRQRQSARPTARQENAKSESASDRHRERFFNPHRNVTGRWSRPVCQRKCAFGLCGR